MRKTRKAKQPAKTQNKKAEASNILPLTWLACLAAFSAFVAATPFESLIATENSAPAAGPAIEPVGTQFISLSGELPVADIH